MLKTLVKKQLQGMLTARYRTGKGGKQKSKAGFLVYALLMLYVAGVLCFLYFSMMQSLCAPLLSAGLGWLYFALAGILAVVLAVVGSVFLTQATLYEAKDNELLLSLPIPPSKILLARMLSLYVQNFLFGGLVFLPAVIVYGMTTAMSRASLVFCVLLCFLLPLLSLALTCVLAWLTALLTSRMRNKTVFTMVLSLAFFGAYFYFYYQINDYLQLLIANSRAVGTNIRKVLYPLYQMGLAAEGNPKAFLLFAGMSVLLFVAVYYALSRSFIRITTTKRGAAKAKYREKALHVSSVNRSLLRKEVRRFTGSAVYMLNCGLGTILLIIGAAAVLIKRTFLMSLAGQIPGIEGLLPVLGCGAICLVTAPNAVTAPSVSLEGKTLWLLQSLPVGGEQILAAKLKLHLLVTVPASILCGIALDIVLRPSVLMAILMLVVPSVFALLCGELGLLLNLRLPKLDWTNEAVAVKQSMSVVVAIFVNWGILIAFAVLYMILPVGSALSPEVFLLISAVIMATASAALWRVLTTWGVGRVTFLS